MPIPKPHSDEKEEDYIGRCISEISGEYTEEGQPYAICKSTWDNPTELAEHETEPELQNLPDVKEGETPERLADKFYGDSNYHWVILHVNEIIDPRFDWPLTTYQLEQYVGSKYGVANVQATHHWEDGSGNWVNNTYPSATAISNYVYEEDLNEDKRRIKILKPRYLAAVETEFDNKIKQ